ncbi:AMP-binding protein [Parahaliea mediterranea]|uniref:AMP-binding protein n=1 Tax=Parahaliea mediterranea TaxID=651086 RepID=A0A939INA1_9GAMM|nr:AMP-binding protein [Parahaliea mediterranea]MBN7797837.1 AMP-binding protein [Parahaliea mediterranea]
MTHSDPAAAADSPVATLPQMIRHQAAAQPAAAALWWRGEAISYGWLQRRIERLASRLAAAGRAGERVAVLAWNCPAFVELIYAVPASGRVLVPLNVRLAASEWCDQLRSAGVRTLFAGADLLATLRAHPECPPDLELIALDGEYERWLDTGPLAPPPAIRPDDPVWILYTSGSTGRPKGAVLTHRSFLAGLESAAIGRPVLPGDRFFYPFPLFHVAAHNVLLQHRHGAAVVLAPRFDAGDTLRACRELGVTTMSLAPTMIGMLLDHPDFAPGDLAGVRTIGYGASAMPETLLRRLLAQTPVGLCQSYGMTELSGSVSFLTPEDHRRAAENCPELLRSVGRPLASVDIRLQNARGERCTADEPGEVLVRAAQCMAGYWRDPLASEKALADGWLHTGDIGRFDTAGYLYLVDRKKDMIISGGENVASREVEETLRRHRAVRDCAVIGLPDPRWGEVVAAVVQLAREVADAELADHCRRSLAAYKTPRRWLRVEALPLNAAGKVDKPGLRGRYADANAAGPRA